MSVGSLTVARGNYLDNSISGTVTLNSGGTLISTNDAILEFAGTGRGKLAINGGNFIIGPTATKWLMVGYYDTGAGELDITSGNLFLDNSTSIKMCRSGNTGGQRGESTWRQRHVLQRCRRDGRRRRQSGFGLCRGTSSTNTYNLNGGTLTVPQIIALEHGQQHVQLQRRHAETRGQQRDLHAGLDARQRPQLRREN